MINQILQDSLTISHSEHYHSTHLSISEVEDIVLNCNDFDKIKILIEQNRTTFKVTGNVYKKLVKIIKENSTKLNWYHISEKQIFSEEFIREFQDKVKWRYISVYQTLSEEFVREFQDKVNWCAISGYQKLSEDFICEIQYKILSKLEYKRIYCDNI